MSIKHFTACLTMLSMVSFLPMVSAQIQIHERLYWVHPVDSMEYIEVNVIDPFEIASWEGDQVLVTTEVTLHDATKGIMKFFVEESFRYHVQRDSSILDGLLLESYQKRRGPVQVKGRTCYEEVQVKVFVPYTFDKTSDNRWIRREGD